MKKRCVVLKAKKMQSACFFCNSLASIELKKQSKTRNTMHKNGCRVSVYLSCNAELHAAAMQHCMKDVQTHGTRFCAWYYGFCFCSLVPKSNLNHTRGITLKRVTSGGSQLRCLALGQHSSEEISQRGRAVGDTVPI